MPGTAHQLLVFSYHKSGTSLFLHVMTKVAARLGMTLENHYGMVEHLNPAADIVLLPHSLLRSSIGWPYRAIRLIRDPRDIWVSGYLYHRHSTEEWCVNTDFDLSPPIGFPRVDYSVAHRREEWKRDYLKRLNRKSYRLNLLERSRADGLDFELAGYTGWTLETMRDWPAMGVTALDVKLEDAMVNFDGTMTRIFAHFGFSPEDTEAALAVARSEDIRRMDDTAMKQRPQIHSREISKWRDFLPPAHVARFETEHGDLIQALGYELTAPESGQPARGFPSPNARRPTSGRQTEGPAGAADTLFAHRRGATMWMMADGAILFPSCVRPQAFDFVVPAGTRAVGLETGSLVEGGFDASIREIVVRRGPDEIAIAGDDPRLLEGRPHTRLNIPWRVFPRAATVTVRVARAVSGRA